MSNNPTMLLISLVGAAALVVLGVYAAGRVRRWMRDAEPPPPFTLQDLRNMKAAGQISEMEYQAMRAAMLGAAGDSIERARRTRAGEESADPRDDS